MKAMVLRNDVATAVRTAHILAGRGFQTLCVADRDTAQAMIHADQIDLMIMDERVGTQLTHTLALSAERRNPFVSTILMTDQRAEDVDDLYALIPSLYALLGTQTCADITGKIALSAVANSETAALRIARQIDDDAGLANDVDDWSLLRADDQDPDDTNDDDIAALLFPPRDPARITPAYPPRWGDFAGLRPHLPASAPAAFSGTPADKICA